MEKNSLQGFLKTTVKDAGFIKNEVDFIDAMHHLDVDALKSVIAKGYNVSDYERGNGSALIKTMYDCSNVILSIFKKYWPEKYENYYYDVLPITDKATLPEVVKKEVEQAIQLLISVMDILYQNGADINKCGMRIADDTLMGVLLANYKVVNTSSPFCSVINLLNHFQSSELVTWFIGKNGFDLNSEKNAISNLLKYDSKISTEVLNLLLMNGLKIEDYEVVQAIENKEQATHSK